MIELMLAAAVAALPPAADVGYQELASGRDDAAITVITQQQQETDDPAKLINLGVAYARQGDVTRARAMFRAAHTAPERVELETAAGDWVYSRVLARRALAMLDNGTFDRSGVLARK